MNKFKINGSLTLQRKGHRAKMPFKIYREKLIQSQIRSVYQKKLLSINWLG